MSRNNVSYGKLFFVILGAILLSAIIILVIAWILISPYISQLSSMFPDWSQLPTGDALILLRTFV